MQAWEIAAELFENAVPKLLEEEEQTWEENFSVSDFYDQQILLQWGSNVPGSGAPERIMVAAVQAHGKPRLPFRRRDNAPSDRGDSCCTGKGLCLSVADFIQTEP